MYLEVFGIILFLLDINFCWTTTYSWPDLHDTWFKDFFIFNETLKNQDEQKRGGLRVTFLVTSWERCFWDSSEHLWIKMLTDFQLSVENLQWWLIYFIGGTGRLLKKILLNYLDLSKSINQVFLERLTRS